MEEEKEKEEREKKKMEAGSSSLQQETEPEEAVAVEDLYLKEEALPEDDGTSVYLPNLSVDGQ